MRIDPEFRDRIIPLSDEEKRLLEESIVRDGCQDALKAWKEEGLLLDGHHRLEICERLGKHFDIAHVELPDREAALDWIDRNQLGRRNLSPDRASLIRGRIYEREKKAVGRPEKRPQSEAISPERTADRLAKQLGVSGATLERDGAFARSVEKLAPIAPDLPRAIARGEAPPRRDVVEAARLFDEEPKRPAEILKTPHVAHNSGNNEWYTPPLIIGAAQRVLRKIDLDPASSDVANKCVGAAQIFTAENSGLEQPWAGRVWLNPPYANPLINQFCGRLLEHLASGAVTEAIVLVNNATETAWGQALLGACSAVCFPSSRIKFLTAGSEKGSPLQGQMIVYLGGRADRFAAEFKIFGVVR